MIINNGVSVEGRYKIEGYDLDGNLINPETVYNVVTQLFFNSIFAFLNLNTTPSETLYINYFAVGSGTTTAAKTDTTLETEVFRKSVTQKTYTSTVFSCVCELSPAEAVGTIREFGIFANATDVADDGLLISRVNVNIEKNAATKYVITYELEIK
jgi:hypothetical protein